MGWTTLGPWVTALVGPILTIFVLTVWRYTDNTYAEIHALDGKIEGLDRKFDAII